MSDNNNLHNNVSKRRKISPIVDNFSKNAATSSVAEAAAAALAAVTSAPQGHLNNNGSRTIVGTNNNNGNNSSGNVPDSLADVVDPTISGMTAASHHDLAQSIKPDQFSEAAANAFANQFSTTAVDDSSNSGKHARDLQHPHHHHLQQQQQQHHHQQEQREHLSVNEHVSLVNGSNPYNTSLLHGLGTINAATSPNSNSSTNNSNNNNSNNNNTNNGDKNNNIINNTTDHLQGKKLKSIEYKSPIYKKFLFVPLHNKYWTKSNRDDHKYLDFEIQCIFEDNCNWKSTLSSNKGSTTNLRRHLAKAHHVDLKMFDYQNSAAGAPQFVGGPIGPHHNNSGNNNFAQHVNSHMNGSVMGVVAHGDELVDSEDRYISLQRSQALVLNFMAKSGLLTSPGYMSNNNVMFDESLKDLVRYFSLADTGCTDWKRQLQLKALSQIDKMNG